MMTATRRCLRGIVPTILTVAAISPVSAAAAGHWSVQQIPHLREPAASGLLDVSCRSATWCMSVGGSLAARGQLFVERWNGRTWALVHAPVPKGASQSQLGGISCTSARTCIAVGTFTRSGHATPTAERWDGARWALMPVPVPAGTVDAGFLGMTCISAHSCFAVGSWGNRSGDDQALLEQLSGGRWRVRRLSRPGTSSGLTALSGISCHSPAACTAVGYDNAGDGIGAAWNGTTLRLQLGSNPELWSGSELYSVSCASRTQCAAVGGGNDSSSAGAVSNSAVAEWWNGSKWTVREDTDPANLTNYDLFAVSCASSQTCLAVGFISELWNGRSWTIEQLPGTTALDGVSCPSRTLCVAVGNIVRGHQPPSAVIMRWSGGLTAGAGGSSDVAANHMRGRSQRQRQTRRFLVLQ